MWIRWLCTVVILATSGCIFLPKTKATTAVIGTRTSQAVPIAGEREILDVSSAGSVVAVTVRVERSCSRKVYQRIETRRHREVELVFDGGGGWGGGGGGGELLAVLFVVAAEIVILPTSLLVSGIVVAASDEHVDTSERSAGGSIVPCPYGRMNIPVHAVLPSGATLDVLTNELGAAHFEIPASEPAFGSILVTGGALSRWTPYYRDMTACLAAREDVRATGRWAELPRCGATQVELETDAAWQETARAIGLASSGNCAGAFASEPVVRRHDPVVHEQVFLRDPVIAGCLAARKREATQAVDERQREAATNQQLDAQRAAAFEACKRSRGEQLLQAQRIADPAARGKALEKVPRCER